MRKDNVGSMFILIISARPHNDNGIKKNNGMKKTKTTTTTKKQCYLVSNGLLEI